MREEPNFLNLTKKQNLFKKIIFKFFSYLLFFCLIVFLILGIYEKIYSNRIYEGVYLGNLKLGSLKKEEAEFFLKVNFEQIENQGIKFFGKSPLGEKEVVIRPILIALEDPDLSRQVINFDLEKTIRTAMSVGRTGPFNKRLKQILESLLYGSKINAYVYLDKEEIKKNLKFYFESLEKEPENASLLLKNGDFKILPEKRGYFFDYDYALTQLEGNLTNFNNNLIEIPLIYQEPEIKTKDLEKISIQIKKILENSPITLKFEEKKWFIKKDLLIQWLTLKEKEITLDRDKIFIFLNLISKDIDKEAIDAKFKMVEGKVVEFQISQEGRKLDLSESTERIINEILSRKKEIDLVVKKVEPKISIEDVNDLGIKELIGRGVSSFKGSPKNRRHNIKIGAEKLNGLLIKPNEEFSLIKALGEITEKDYLKELVIKGDRTIPELGGGLCQVATTLFRAALFAGLPITQRTPHAFRVIYYEPAGMDATIYPPSVDLRFINDTLNYILIQSKIENDNLIFEFYGKNDGRKVEITQPKIFNIVPPGPPLFIETTELEPGTKKQVEKRVNGADTEFTRTIIYPNNEKKVEVWRSHYRPWREVWLVGVEKKEDFSNQ
jgi:vancomycin resistance protein YoaR